MYIFYLIIFFILGTIMGSFYTVIGTRLPIREDFIRTKSHCDHCCHTLNMFDMIPILSFVFLKGRCRYCQKEISNISTYMELFTGILFLLSFYIFGLSYELFIALGIVSLLIIISVSDISYFIIPDEVLIFFAGYFLIMITLKSGIYEALLSIGSGLVMFLLMYLVMLLGNFLFKKESLGGGDIKLMFVVGLLLHPLLGIFVIFIASVIALPVSLLLLLKNNKNIIPFGPFLIVALMLLYYTRIDSNYLIDFIKNL